MRYGILYNVEYSPQTHGSPSGYYRQILEQIKLAEDLGFDAAWFGEHHYSSYSFGAPAVIATAAAARTATIKLGTGVSLIPLGQPLRLAEEYAMLDVLSNGRLEYGAGRGFLNLAYSLLGTQQAESVERTHEGLLLIRTLWEASGPVTHHGRFWDLEDYVFAPRPVQQPAPPIYSAASTSAESFRWAGENGFNLCTSIFGRLRPEEIALNLEGYRQALAGTGTDPATREVAVVTQMYCTEREQDIAQGMRYATNYYNFLAGLFESGGQPVSDGYLAEARQGRLDTTRVAIGTPDTVYDRLEWIKETFNPTMLLMETAQGGTPPAESNEVLRTFAKHFIN
jgi:alkanesulfonate monooxygenase SsuD/methylene tetrahydromethanopterin reductase-like flavin-dependent oxidoreductase (luciferase family)